jgi:hypothetical protein
MEKNVNVKLKGSLNGLIRMAVLAHVSHLHLSSSSSSSNGSNGSSSSSSVISSSEHYRLVPLCHRCVPP